MEAGKSYHLLLAASDGFTKRFGLLGLCLTALYLRTFSLHIYSAVLQTALPAYSMSNLHRRTHMFGVTLAKCLRTFIDITFLLNNMCSVLENLFGKLMH